MSAPDPLFRPSVEPLPRQRQRRRGGFLRGVLILLGLGAVLAIALYVVMASALDPQRLRTALQDAVLRATGRTLAIAGPVHLDIGLSPQLEVEDIALANIDGGTRPHLLTAKKLSAHLALLPLLSGDAVISSLVISQPDMLLERTADGTPNWQFTESRRPLYQGHSSSGGGGSHHTEIHEIVLENGQVSYLPHEGAPIAVHIDEATLSADNPDAPIALSVAGALPSAQPGGASSLPFTLTGNFGSLQRLQGQNVSALAGAWPMLVKLSMQGADVKLDGGINHPEQMRAYQIRLTLHAENLGVFNALLPKPQLPPLQGVKLTALLSDSGDGALRSSQLSLHTEKSDLSAYVPGLVVSQAVLTAPGPGQLAQLAIDGTYQEQKLRIAAAVTQPDVLSTTAPLQLTVSAQAAGGNLSAHGTVPQSMQTAGLDMQIEAHSPHLSDLSPLVGRSLPNADNVALTAELEDAGVKLHGLTMHNFVFSSSLGDLNGDVTVNWSPRGSITGTLASRTLNLDALSGGAPISGLPAIWTPAGNETPAEGAAPQPVAPSPAYATPAARQSHGSALGLPLPFLRNNDAALTLNIGNLTAGGASYRDVAAHLELQDGKLTLNPLRADSADGMLIGGISLDATTDTPPIAVSLRSPAIGAHAIAQVLGYPQQGTSGTVQVDATLSGTGQTLAAFESGMNGHLGLAMVNGALDNALLQGLLGDVLQAQGVPALGDGNTAVRCLALRMDFTHGDGHVRALALDTSRLALSGTGNIDLSARTADLHLRPQLRLGPTDVASAVILQGDFGALHAALDPAFGNGRVGLSIGGGASSGCGEALAVARNGLGGPLPVAAPPQTDLQIPLNIKKPKDLLQGLFH